MMWAAVLSGMLLAPRALAQQLPDFSGTWTIDAGAAGAADGPHTLVIAQVLVTTDVRGEPTAPMLKELTVERQFDGAAHTESYQPGVVSGTVPGSPDGTADDANTYQSVMWEGQVLVIESASHTGETRRSGTWTERRERWLLGADGLLRIDIAVSSSSDPPRQVALAYRRRP